LSYNTIRKKKKIKVQIKSSHLPYVYVMQIQFAGICIGCCTSN